MISFPIARPTPLTAHFPLPSAGSVKREGDAFRFDYWHKGRLI